MRYPILALLIVLPATARAQEPATYDDPFYKQKGRRSPQASTDKVPFLQIEEQVDPFTGNLNINHTDLVLPGKGGLSLKIQRSYNSRIWGRKDTSFPGLVALNERSVAGLGWSFHFGRVRNPRGTGSSNRFLPDNPVVELPDGSSHPLYRDIRDATGMRSRQWWRYRAVAGTPLAYELTTTDGLVYRFSSALAYQTGDGVPVFQVERITDRNGNVLTFSYDPSDARLVTSVRDSVGRVVTFGYETITGPACSYRTLSAIQANGRSYLYRYQLSSCRLLLSEVVSPEGLKWSYEYHTSGVGLAELARVNHPGGASVSYDYQDVRFDVGAVDIPFTVVRSRTLGGRDVPAATWTYSFAATGASDQVTTIDRGGCGTERWTFASFGRLNQGQVNILWRIGLPLVREIANGSTVVERETFTWAPSAPISRDELGSGAWNGTTGFLFDGDVHAPILTARRVDRDGRAYSTTYSDHDEYGTPRLVTESGEATRTTSTTYFYETGRNLVKGRPLTETINAFGRQRTNRFTYDVRGNMLTSDRGGVSTTFGYTDGDVTTRRDARGNTTSFGHARGAIERIVNPLYTVTRTISWEGLPTSETDGRGNTTRREYDRIGRIAAIRPPLETARVYNYDSAGASWSVTRGSATSRTNLDGLGRSRGNTDPEGVRTTVRYDVCGNVAYRSYPFTTSDTGDGYQYDLLGRITRHQHPDGAAETIAYAGGRATRTNERGVATAHTYTAFGDPEQSVLTGVQGPAGVASYRHDAGSELLAMDAPGGLARTYERNAAGFILREQHPETGVISYGRDATGNMTTRTRASETTRFSYDALDRLVRMEVPGGEVQTRTYDNADNRLSTASALVSTSNTFDAENRLTRQVMTVGGRSFTTSYDWDALGNLASITYPTGRVVRYRHDRAARVTSVDGFGTLSYHPSGTASAITHGNGRVVNVALDARHRVASVRATGLVDLAYGYDAAGNLLSVVDTRSRNNDRSLTYDSADRLIRARGRWGDLSYTYDARGNRVSETLDGTTTSYGYSAENRLLSASGAGATTFTHDARGNLSSVRGRSLEFDGLGQLVRVAGSVTYGYDGEGRMVTRSEGSSKVLYHRDQQGNILAETDETGRALAEYVYVNGRHLARITPTTPAPVVTVTAPAEGATVAGTVAVSAEVAPASAVAGVSFELDGQPLGSEDAAAPYSVPWSTGPSGNGAHRLRAVARLSDGTRVASALRTVTVLNPSCTGDDCNRPAWVGQDTSIGYYGGASIWPKAQSFLAPGSQITRVDLHTCCTRVSPWSVRILTALPRGSGSVEGIEPADLAAKTVAVATVASSSAGWVSFYFTTPVPVTADAQYFLFVDSYPNEASPNDGNWTHSLFGDFPGPYIPGTGWIYIYRWNDNSNYRPEFLRHVDYAFRVWR